jgi:hypothetical protein
VEGEERRGAGGAGGYGGGGMKGGASGAAARGALGLPLGSVLAALCEEESRK